MSLWDALSGKTYKQNKLVGDNIARILTRLQAVPDGFEKHWCMACIVATKVFVEMLLFEELKGKREDGRTGDINPFHLNLNGLTPQRALHLFRISAAHRLALFLVPDAHRGFLEQIGLSVEDLEDTVATVFEFDDEDKDMYREVGDFSSQKPFSGYKTLYEKMLVRAYGIEPVPDIAVITFVAGLLSTAGKVFGDTLNER